MALDTITQTFTGVAYTHRQCWCGISFAIPKSLSDYYQRTNEEKPESFAIHCPLGHGMVPNRRHSEADRLRDELAREKHRTEQARADAEHQRRTVAMKDRQLRARKGQVTKIRRRIEQGVCPCCNRYFANLHQHMQGQHPDWNPDAVADDAIGENETGVVVVKRGRDLKALRESLGLSRREAAKILGIKSGTLHVFESLLRRSPPQRAFDLLSKAKP